MRLIRILVATAIVVLVPILTATAAHATITGPCTASGTINGTTYSASQASAVIPRTGDVTWKGAINRRGSGKRHIEGKVLLELPPPLPDIQLAGSWNGPSSRYANSGKYHYDLPSVLIGPKVTVSGHHTEPGIACTGSIDIRLSGSKLKNPVLLTSLAFTLLAVLNMSLVIRVKKS